eukprot:CAMPEP_0202897962 /NCGR_PEP_ID=MMETSP1392-20130828/6587_1 /ASSEMBLY_ACC=CAM_ASM_000868 /TAXON_ID=225041 /ORGANISM="Chlamydomonas chlamydogama, Strain SAG 11-48b" /LENGTH=115 /DNA_ID=CAMNT_0049583739 /DNA_START=69 /DNA_END=416 /DNA_ORIENTATION=-
MSMVMRQQAMRQVNQGQRGARPSAFGVQVSTRRAAITRSRKQVTTTALLGPDGDKKKFLTREEEPEQYWSSPGEKDGGNPFKDPIAIIGIVAILFPFLFVLVAIGTGAIDTSVYR